MNIWTFFWEPPEKKQGLGKYCLKTILLCTVPSQPELLRSKCFQSSPVVEKVYFPTAVGNENKSLISSPSKPTSNWEPLSGKSPTEFTCSCLVVLGTCKDHVLDFVLLLLTMIKRESSPCVYRWLPYEIATLYLLLSQDLSGTRCQKQNSPENINSASAMTISHI